jgi:hypothetical protein
MGAAAHDAAGGRVTRDRPAGADLLAIARETLLRDLVPGLPDERKVAALMVARAIEIAQREAAAGDVAARTALAAAAALYGDPAPAGDVDAAWQRYAKRLAGDLRAGTLDAAQRDAAWRALFAHADARVAESNPRVRED